MALTYKHINSIASIIAESSTKYELVILMGNWLSKVCHKGIFNADVFSVKCGIGDGRDVTSGEIPVQLEFDFMR